MKMLLHHGLVLFPLLRGIVLEQPGLLVHDLLEEHSPDAGWRHQIDVIVLVVEEEGVLEILEGLVSSLLIEEPFIHRDNQLLDSSISLREIREILVLLVPSKLAAVGEDVVEAVLQELDELPGLVLADVASGFAVVEIPEILRLAQTLILAVPHKGHHERLVVEHPGNKLIGHEHLLFLGFPLLQGLEHGSVNADVGGEPLVVVHALELRGEVGVFAELGCDMVLGVEFAMELRDVITGYVISAISHLLKQGEGLDLKVLLDLGQRTRLEDRE